jgi:hypothetical protein
MEAIKNNKKREQIGAKNSNGSQTNIHPTIPRNKSSPILPIHLRALKSQKNNSTRPYSSPMGGANPKKTEIRERDVDM